MWLHWRGGAGRFRGTRTNGALDTFGHAIAHADNSGNADIDTKSATQPHPDDHANPNCHTHPDTAADENPHARPSLFR